MALTKIKLNTMVTGTLPDANIPDDITIDTAASVPASGLTGNTLASGVTASSLTSVGTLSSLDVSGAITAGTSFTLDNASGSAVIRSQSSFNNTVDLTASSGGDAFIEASDTSQIKIGHASGTKLIIDTHANSGRVGIGVSPTTKFEVQDGNGIPLRFGDVASTPSATAGYIGMSTSAYSGNNGDLVLIPRTSASSNILLMEGNVGIGDTSPSNFVEILAADGVGDDIFALRVQNQEATDGRSYGLKVMAGSNSSDTTFELNDHDGTNVLMKVLGNGNVGIGGVTSPSSPLTVKTSSYSSNIAKFQNPSATTLVGAYCTGNPGSGQFYVADAGGTTKVLLNSIGDSYFTGGDVGIGTTSPSYKFQVVDGDNNGSVAFMQDNYDGTVGGTMDIILGFKKNDGNFRNAAIIRAAKDDIYTTNTQADGRLEFYTTLNGTSTQRMKIDSTGRVMFFSENGITAPTGTDAGSGTLAGGAGFFPNSVGRSILYIGTYNYTAAAEIARFTNQNGIVGTISINGSSTSFNTSSDYRLKENEVLISDGLTRLNQLKPYRFNFIADADTTVDGFFAHEVADIVPEAIMGEKDAVDDDGNIKPQSIDHSKLVPLLVKAVQELSAKVKALENA